MQLKHKARKKHGGDGVERLAVNLPAPVREFIYEPPVAPSIWPRRLFHLAAGLSLPAAILVVPEHIMQWVLVAASLAAILLELSRGLVPTANDWVFTWLPLFKSQERYQVTGATFLILGATAAYFAFDNEIVVLALVFLAVGDPLAALVGRRDHRLRIFEKSVVGSAAFVVVAVAAGAVVTLHPDVPLAWWLIPGAVAAAVAELLPIPIDDNLTIPLASASLMALLAML